MRALHRPPRRRRRPLVRPCRSLPRQRTTSPRSKDSPRRQTPSAAAGVDRRAGPAMRLLPERPDPPPPKPCSTRVPNPTDAQIRESMNGTLCRCMTYYRVQAAIKRAANIKPNGCSVRGNRTMPDPTGKLNPCYATHRRNFLKSAGMLLIGVAARFPRARPNPLPAPIPTPTSTSSIPGSPSTPTTPLRFTSARPIAARAPAPASAS